MFSVPTPWTSLPPLALVWTLTHRKIRTASLWKMPRNSSTLPSTHFYWWYVSFLMSIHVCMIFVEGGVGEENVLEWGGEEIFYTILFWKFNFFIYLFLLRRTKSGKIALYKKRKHDKFSIIKLAKYACWVLVKGFLVKSVLYKCRIFFSLTVMFPKIDALFDLLGISPLNRRNIMGFFRSVASQAVTFRKEDSSVRDLCEISGREIVLYVILWDIRKGDSSVLCEIS